MVRALNWDVKPSLDNSGIPFQSRRSLKLASALIEPQPPNSALHYAGARYVCSALKPAVDVEISQAPG
jgi:hypothetical protein